MRPLRIGSDAANARTSRQIFDRRAIGGVLNPPEFPIRKMVAFAAQETEYVLENDSGLRERRSHTNCFAAVAMQRPGRIDNRRRDAGDQGRFTIASGKAQCSRAAIPERAARESPLPGQDVKRLAVMVAAGERQPAQIRHNGIVC